MDEMLRTIAVFALPVILAITVHDAAHARMTSCPLVHIDPFGTTIIPT